MYYCNNLKTLSVLSLYEGELLGVVDKIYFSDNLKKVVEIGIVSNEGATLALQTKNIYNVGKNAITVKNNQVVTFKTNNNLHSCPIGSKAYSLNGEFLGIVKEIAINNKFVTEKIILENEKSLDIDQVATIGKNTVIFYDENKKTSLKKFTPKSPKIFKTEISTETTALPIKQDAENTQNPEIIIEQPKVIVQSSELLIGRICTKDIFNFNNELLVKQNTKLNKKQLKEVIKFGKLRELMLYLK